MFALVNARILVPAGLREDLCVVINGERIRAVSTQPPPDAEIVDLKGGTLLPGFIDTQVNGGGGRLFNDDPSVETVTTIAAAHRRFGTTALLPTLISDDLSVVAKAIAAVDEAIAAGVPGIAGIHIEGPFLNPERKGIHDPSKFRQIDEEALRLLTSLERGRTLVTLAPERTEPEMIARLAKAGVIVAAGHTNADYETVRTALAHGLSGFTHIFNAMSPFTSRAPGVVGAALEARPNIAGIIVDGHHLHPATVRIALAAKGSENLMLVTDAMPCVGTDDQCFDLQGKMIRRVEGRLVDTNGTLAGSVLDMASAVRNAIEMGGLDLPRAAAMASSVPARFLHLNDEMGAISAGLRADLVLIDKDLVVQRTWIGGVAEDAGAAA